MIKIITGNTTVLISFKLEFQEKNSRYEVTAGDGGSGGERKEEGKDQAKKIRTKKRRGQGASTERESCLGEQADIYY